jgi:uncharacterized protein (TIGR02145 family)/uncharacterized repeat protein (TIGR02543 family)
LATTATLFYTGCGDKGASSEVRGDGNVKSLINRMRGTNEPKAPDLYTLSVIKSPETGGTVFKSPDKEQYEKGESVMIIATPESDYRFTGWSGASSSANASVTITMDGNKNLTANFLPVNVVSYSLNVIANPETGGSVSKSPDKLEYASDETVYITATAETGYRFAGWSGSQTSTDATMTVTMDGSKELIANFAPQTYTLAINAKPANGGSVSSNPGKSAYAYNEQVTVTATANAGYKFTGWSGVLSSTDASETITMDGDKELTANFEWQGTTPPPDDSNPTYTLIAYPSPTDGGTVSNNPHKTSYNANENVYVTAEAAEGYRFVGWSGASGSQNKSVTITMNGDKELIAIFEILTYTLTVSANPSSSYGTVSRNPDRTTYNHGTSVTVTASANSGYRFTGWTGASSTSANVAITMDGNKTLTANFEQIPTYMVTFSANGGSGSVSSRSAQAGNSITLPDGSSLSRSDYAFGGWNTNSDGSGTNYNVNSTYTPTANITLYAKWNAVYTVTFNLNGGSGSVYSQSVQPGSSVTLPDGSGLSRNNYTFDGWNTNSSGTGTNYGAGSPYTPNNSITLYAKWNAVYTVTFSLNNGSGTAPGARTVNAGSSTTLPDGSGLTRSGYTFGGWNTNSNGTGTNYNASSTYTPTANVTMYAKWNIVTYAITFNANGGTVTTASGTTGAGWTLASLPTPTRTGYTFNGWYTATTGGTQVTMNTPFSADATIYAQWTLITYSITFNAVNGTVSPTSGTTGADRKLASLPTPTRSGCIFVGWYTTSTGGTEVTTNTEFSANATIYARWNWVGKGNNINNYKTVVIGTQTWMAENLDYDVEGSECYGNSADSCAKYGRLYNWSTAMGGASSSSLSPSGVRGVCPVGWHIPSDAEWTRLANYVGDASMAGTKLKATSGWYDNGNGTDQYGFTALPGGNGYSDGSFDVAGYSGYWWSATEYIASSAWYRYMNYSIDYVNRSYYVKTILFSVRCAQD